jgi:hypothetical protein
VVCDCVGVTVVVRVVVWEVVEVDEVELVDESLGKVNVGVVADADVFRVDVVDVRLVVEIRVVVVVPLPLPLPPPLPLPLHVLSPSGQQESVVQMFPDGQYVLSSQQTPEVGMQPSPHSFIPAEHEPVPEQVLPMGQHRFPWQTSVSGQYVFFPVLQQVPDSGMQPSSHGT